MAAGVGRLVNQNRTTPRAEDVDVGREKASARSHRCLSVWRQHQRAREQPARPAHRTTAAAAQAPTHYHHHYCAHNTAHSTRHRHERAGLRIAHWRPFFLGRGLSTLPSHRLLQSCDRPQPPTVICFPFHSSEPSPLLRRQGETTSDAPTQSDFVQIVTFAFRRATLV